MQGYLPVAFPNKPAYPTSHLTSFSVTFTETYVGTYAFALATTDIHAYETW